MCTCCTNWTVTVKTFCSLKALLWTNPHSNKADCRAALSRKSQKWSMCYIKRFLRVSDHQCQCQIHFLLKSQYPSNLLSCVWSEKRKYVHSLFSLSLHLKAVLNATFLEDVDRVWQMQAFYGHYCCIYSTSDSCLFRWAALQAGKVVYKCPVLLLLE